MRKRKIYMTWLAVLIMHWSCKEIYFPDDIVSHEQIPVISGMIQEGATPYVKLSWALGYNDHNTNYISGADVRIADDLDNYVDLEETSAGYYTALSGAFKGVVGRTYTMQVVLPDGNEYVSSPVLLRKSPSVDSLYAEPGIRKYYNYNVYNEPIAENQRGLYVLADLGEEADSILYYRFHTTVVKETTYTQDPGTLFAQTVFVWITYTLDSEFSVNHSVGQEDRQLLLEHPVGFLHFDYDPSQATSKATAPYPNGWVLVFKVYSISQDVYDYYNSIALQLTSKDQMFAPVPSQVKSTIRCVTDPDKEVIGVFEASSFTTVYKGFAFKDLYKYSHIDLQSFPENVYNGVSIPFPPDFWVPFN